MARFDRVIPPGGTGKVILTVDTERITGEFVKRATIWSNDPERNSTEVEMVGEVKPYISLEPGGYVPLWGSEGEVPPAALEIVNNSEKPVAIQAIRPEKDLEGRIRWRLEPIKPGFAYRLEIQDIPDERGEYTGHLVILTDHPEKPALPVIVNRHVIPKQ